MRKSAIILITFLALALSSISCVNPSGKVAFAFASTSEIVDWGDEEIFIDPMGEIFLTGRMIDDKVILIEVKAQDFKAPILGFSFYLDYPKDNLAFLRYENGDFLEQGGKPIYLVKNRDLEGQIVFGSTLRRSDSFPVGGGTLARFYFDIINKKETYSFNFKDGIASSLDEVRQDLERVLWRDLELQANDQNASVSSQTNMNASLLQETISRITATGGEGLFVQFTVLLFLIGIIGLYIFRKTIKGRSDKGA